MTVAGAELIAAPPVRLASDVNADYVVTPDGQTFYTSRAQAGKDQPVRVITNWAEALRKNQ